MTARNRSPREIAGYLCVAAGFALVIALGTGALDPIGMSAPAASGAAMLRALVPSVALALVLFVTGLWLLKGKRRP
jgi:hypothetical protein